MRPFCNTCVTVFWKNGAALCSKSFDDNPSAAERLQHGPKMSRTVRFRPMRFHDRPGGAKESPKKSPRGPPNDPNLAQNCSKRASGSAQGDQRGLQVAQHSPMMPKSPSNRPKRAPNRPCGGPEGPSCP
eukprot:5985928-Pyramimonas_sp.AAC.1